MRICLLIAVVALWTPNAVAGIPPDAVTPAMVATARKLTQQAGLHNTGYAIVESLTTEVGPRLAGTEAEGRARQWALSKFRELGFHNVRVEPFMVPLWLRGIERAEITSPFPQPLTITALGAAPGADQLGRTLSRGEPVIVKLVITPQLLPATESGNVIAEIPGSAAPEEIVLVGAHLDSWDLGTGAIDDGAGIGIVIGATKLLLDFLPNGPRRTIRIVLFGSEEVGLVGAQAYAEQHAGELQNHVIATESDFGAGNIWRFDTGVADDKVPLAGAIGELLRPLGIEPGTNTATGGPDIKYLREAGVPVVGLKQNGWDYFDLHRTPDDTQDKIASDALDQKIAAYAVLLYLAAEIEADFR
ncbi:MAG: hypothetical protein DRR04_04215 [Gammaproteobacteria bacterium]|nr:MAG: hypothetical protein DRQ97_03385 [Gammaproteobacteria bacterium]RLA60950.1 MAG: hypothetical protein DRR04_04215 [Gammaproteobacteria bacterium]